MVQSLPPRAAGCYATTSQFVRELPDAIRQRASIRDYHLTGLGRLPASFFLERRASVQAARRSNAVRTPLGLINSPCGLRDSLRWPYRSSFAKRFSFFFEPKCSLTLPFFFIIT